MNDFCASCGMTPDMVDDSTKEMNENNKMDHDGGHAYILYSTDCPKCKILEEKMEAKQLDFEVCKNIQPVIDHGFMSAPVLYCKERDEYLPFAEAVKLINNMNMEGIEKI